MSRIAKVTSIVYFLEVLLLISAKLTKIDDINNENELQILTPVIAKIERALEVHDVILNGLKTQVEELQGNVQSVRLPTGTNFINVFFNNEQQVNNLTTKTPVKDSEANNHLYKELCRAEIQSGHAYAAFETYSILVKKDENCLESIISKAYDNDVKNVENILKFSNIFDRHQQGDIIWTLYDEMVNNQDVNNYQIFLVAYRVKKLIDSRTVDTTRSPPVPLINPKLLSLKAKLPHAVRTIIFDNNNVCLRTSFFGGNKEYLFAQADDMVYDKDRRYIFTNRGNNLQVNTQKVWVFEPAQEGRYFSIMSKVYGEYLYAAANDLTFDHSRRKVFTWRPKTAFDTAEWELQLINGGNSIYVKQRFLHEYLYPLDGHQRDNYRRDVFTWRDPRAKGYESKQYDWLIEAC